MEKLVLVYSWGDEGCSGTTTVPFTYSSKADFVLHCLVLLEEAIKNYKESGAKWDINNVGVDIMGCYLYKLDIEGIEHSVYTLEEWFEKHRIKASK